MNQETLKKEYSIIEERIAKVVSFLEKHKDSSKYKDLYKGISTLQSPLISQPEILFIGINNGDGAYREANNSLKTSENKTPLRWYNEPDSLFPSELNWFEKGNARGRFTELEEKNWEGYEWHQRDKKVNNIFPKNMIDLLYAIAKLKYPEAEHNEDDNTVPFWYEELGKRVMYTNLYPISTTKVKQLKPIHVHLAKEPELRALWKEAKGDERTINEWVVRKYFMTSISRLVKLVEPKLIVCMGMTATNDFTFEKHKDKKIVTTERTFGDRKVPIIGFSREGNWNSIIPEIAKTIVR